MIHVRGALAIGETSRFLIEVNSNIDGPVFVRLRNRTKATRRATYLLGPFVLYCDSRPVIPANQNEYVPQFKANIEPQGKFTFQLKPEDARDVGGKRCWIIDVVSEVLFNQITKVDYELLISLDINNFKKSKYQQDIYESIEGDVVAKQYSNHDIQEFIEVGAKIKKSQTKERNQHLVIVTHGMISNVSNDMMYIMEQLRAIDRDDLDEELILDGYTGNVCRTELGIKNLGIRLANYIVKERYNTNIKKISFIGHSLGGLVQTFAIAYIYILHGWFFDAVKPVNFISLATPFLGLYSHIGNYTKRLLSSGALGQTGEDLRYHSHNKLKNFSILYLLSGDPAHSILQKFERRTLYANAINDGIVPLASSALLYLDYSKILKDSNLLKKETDDIRSIVMTWKEFQDSEDFKVYKKVNPKSKIFRRVSLTNTVGNLVLPEPPKNITSDMKVLIHDQVYQYNDIPDSEYFPPDGIDEIMAMDRHQLQECMARRWHAGKSWRKVIVCLEGDAHNSINVRRRYSNSCGWAVISHMILNHFIKPQKCDVPEADIVSQPASRDEADMEPNKTYAWLLKEDKEKGGLIRRATNALNPIARRL
ncbi:Putative serine esterase (DUF676) [Nakaseomyces glabratus]|nr:hypothetical protein LTX96_0004710 [Nakaseomyces glabratus]